MKKKLQSFYNKGLLSLSILFAGAGIVIVPLCCGLSLTDTGVCSEKSNQEKPVVIVEKL